MRKTAVPLASALFMVASTLSIQAATVAGVNLPDTTTVGDKTLVLNGLGLRTEFMVKVYVAGLYLEHKSTDAGGITKADAPKKIVMQFLHDASQKQMTDAFDQSFKDNAPDAETTIKTDTDKFLAALEPVKVGEQMVFTYVPGTGTTFAINGKDKLTIAGPAFGQTIFSVWLGPKPPTSSLKKGMLGE
jgi:Chalcone isomerase-like